MITLRTNPTAQQPYINQLQQNPTSGDFGGGSSGGGGSGNVFDIESDVESDIQPGESDIDMVIASAKKIPVFLWVALALFVFKKRK